MSAIYRNYLDMKDKFQNLLSAYEQKCAESARLGKRLQEVGRENRKLQGQAADLGRVRKALGTEVIERAINEIKVKERNVRQAHDRS